MRKMENVTLRHWYPRERTLSHSDSSTLVEQKKEVVWQPIRLKRGWGASWVKKSIKAFSSGNHLRLRAFIRLRWTKLISAASRFLSIIYRILIQTENTNLIIMDIFQGVADNTNPHVDQVRGGHLKDLLRKLLTVLVDFLQRRKKKKQLQTAPNNIYNSDQCIVQAKRKHPRVLKDQPPQSNELWWLSDGPLASPEQFERPQPQTSPWTSDRLWPTSPCSDPESSPGKKKREIKQVKSETKGLTQRAHWQTKSWSFYLLNNNH